MHSLSRQIVSYYKDLLIREQEEMWEKQQLEDVEYLVRLEEEREAHEEWLCILEERCGKKY